MLRGVAQVQNQVNQGQKIYGKMLRVVIANDGRNVDQGVEIAKSLTSQGNILGVIGHMSSDVTLEAVPVYEEGELVLISPTSTAVSLSEVGDFFFRSVSSDSVTATTLATYLVYQVGQKDVAVFYNSGSTYSQSLRYQFYASFAGIGGTVVKDFDFSESGFNARNAVEEAKNLGAKVLVLLPNTSTRPQAINVAEANNGRYCMVAGDSFYNSQTLELENDAANHLVVATPWHRDKKSRPNISWQSKGFMARRCGGGYEFVPLANAEPLDCDR